MLSHKNFNFETGLKSYYKYDSDSFTFYYDESYNAEVSDEIDNYLQNAGNVHKEVRQEVKEFIKPGLSYRELVKKMEDKMYEKSKTFSFPSGISFPVGINVNEIVAHDTCNFYKNRSFKKGDLLKLDFGFHCNGYTVDSAQSIIVDDENSSDEVNEKYKNDIDNKQSLIDATREATSAAIAMCGVDTKLTEISEIIDETIKSYEITLDNGKTQEVYPVRGLYGHDIGRWKVHNGKIITSRPEPSNQGNMKIDDGDIIAMETFATTLYTDNSKLNSYLINNSNMDKTHFEFNSNFIDENGYLIGVDRMRAFRKIPKSVQSFLKEKTPFPFNIHDILFRNLVSKKEFMDVYKNLKRCGIIENSPTIGSGLCSQMEHTLRVRENGVKIFTLDDDY
jgi:methionine aminopeptidase